MTQKCHYFAKPSLRKTRFLGRIIACLHLLLFHKNTSNKKSFFIEILRFLLRGKSEKLGYWYRDYSLLRLPDKDSEPIFREIFEEHVYNLNLSTANPTIIDIGSNIGFSILFFRKKFPRSKIYCYEANPILINFLLENIAHNLSNADDIYIFNKAVIGETYNHRSFYYDSNHFGWGSFYRNYIVRPTNKDRINRIRVEKIKFSELIKDISYIDILKIDAEGVEYELLPAIKKYSNKINSFIMEIHQIPDKNYFDLLSQLSARYKLAFCCLQSKDLLNDFLINRNPVEPNYFIVYGINRFNFK